MNFDSLAGQDICILGGTGTIGTALIDGMLKYKPRRIRCVTNDEYSLWCTEKRFGSQSPDNPVRYILKDIRNEVAMREILRGVDILYMLAAYKHVQYVEYSPQEAIDVNIHGNMNVIEEAIANGRIQKVVNVSCLDENTRIVTSDGLKRWDEVESGMRTLTLNSSGEIEENEIEEVVTQGYSGDMIQIKTRSIDMLLTPNHKMLLHLRNNVKPVVEEPASRVTTRSNGYLPKGAWTGTDEEWFSLPVPPRKTLRGRRYRLRNCPARVKTSDLLYLLGVFIGDGFLACHEKRDNDFGAVFLDIPAKDKARKKVLTTLDRMGIAYKCYSGRAGEHIYFSSKALAEVFLACGRGARNKTIPSWALTYSPNLLRSLLNGLIDSDGYRKGKMQRLTSTSIKLMERCAELATKCGMYFTISVQRGGETRIEGRDIPPGDAYVGLFSSSNLRGFSRHHCRRVQYEGTIWCVRVKRNHNFLAERNGKFFFTGNTDKVCYANSTYGLSKHIVEKIIEWASFYRPVEEQFTKFANTRFGNVIGSRGSVLEHWFDPKTKVIGLRDPSHVRYFMATEKAIDLVLTATEKMKGGETFIFKMPTVRMGDLADVVSEITSKPIKALPELPGETLHQYLMTMEESVHRIEDELGFTLHKDFPACPRREYSTKNECPLDKESIKKLLEEWEPCQR